MKKKLLTITFHNPNTGDETARFLIKILAESIVNHLFDNKKQHITAEQINDNETVSI